jgi:hypothetical protein
VNSKYIMLGLQESAPAWQSASSVQSTAAARPFGEFKGYFKSFDRHDEVNIRITLSTGKMFELKVSVAAAHAPFCYCLLLLVVIIVAVLGKIYSNLYLLVVYCVT